MNREDFQLQARLLRALANDLRLSIVHQLSSDDQSVGQLASVVGCDHSTMSKHLSVLRAEGIVADRREANRVVYRLAMPCAVKFLLCATEALRTRRDAFLAEAPEGPARDLQPSQPVEAEECSG